MSDPTTCIIADCHPAMVTALGDILGRSGFDVVGRGRNGAEALSLIESERPDIALMDVRMPRLSGFEVASQAATTAPDTSIIFYAAHGDHTLVSDALAAGVRGYVLKDAPLDELLRAVERVAAGEAYVDPVFAGALVSRRSAERMPLTQRERDVLRLLADGLSNEDIGVALHISPETVRTHVRKSMAKLEAETRTQAVAIALRQSIIS
jgi:DNA-binding NarL/FixJ family response regulator